MTSKEDLDFALADMYNEGSDDEREAALQEAMAGEAALQEDLDFALAEMCENEYQSDVEGEAALHEAMAAETTPYAPPQQSASDGDKAPKPADVPPKSICVGDVVGKDIRAALVALLRNRDLDATTVKEIRGEVAMKLGLGLCDLDSRKDEAQSIAKEVIALVCVKLCKPHTEAESLGEERARSVKSNQLVTLPHPRQDKAECGTPLRAPGEFTREGVRDALLEALAAQQRAKITMLYFDLMGIHREHHEDGEAHSFHVMNAMENKQRFKQKEFGEEDNTNMKSHEDGGIEVNLFSQSKCVFPPNYQYFP